MLKVGLTGGIGCGKSTAVDAFRVLGIPIIDADQISKELVRPRQPALIKIVAAFGEKILQEKGELNRSLLKTIVFSDDSALELLENILHPLIKNEITKKIQILEAQVTTQLSTQAPYVIVDVPLLLEKSYQKIFDRIIVIDCFPEQQIERVIKRDTLNEKTIKKIMRNQASRKEDRKSVV